jgi:hypothetical protein
MAAPGYEHLRALWERLPEGQWSAAQGEGEPISANSFEELLGSLRSAGLTLSDVTFAYKPGTEEIIA